MILEAIFIANVLIVFYIYAGYPISLAILSLFNTQKKGSDEPSNTPMVTIIIPAFNEEDHIVENLENKTCQSYPKDRMEIIVVSDESTDKTDQLVNDFSKSSPVPITLIRQCPRQGKTAGVNLATEKANGEILVFADANSIYAEDTISTLVQSFLDPEVGYVTGKMVYTNSDGSLVGDGCSAYMKYENSLRKLETQVGSIVGVDGGVDAMRKSIHTQLNADQLPDFVQPLQVITKGYKVIYNENALLKEEALSSSDSEFRMRVRVSLRAYWAMWDMKHLFNPIKFKLFSYQLLIHKLFRYLAFVPLILALMSNILLANNAFWAVILCLHLLFYALALTGHFKSSSNGLVKLCYYFCLINIASAIAFSSFLRGKKIIIWKPRVGQ